MTNPMTNEADISSPHPSPASHRSRSRKRERAASRDAIIATAISLFQEKGYVNTSLSEIARQVNMDPSSLYYYFPSKQALLEAVTRPENLSPSLDYLSPFSNKAAQQLYALIIHDVVHKCELPIDFIEMEEAAYQTPGEFSLFFKHYQTSYHNMVKVIETGVAQGEFKTCEPDERAVTILSINEGLQHHYHTKQRNRLILATSGYTARNYTPEEIGHLGARSVLPSLVTSDIDLAQVSAEGMELYYHLRKQLHDHAQ